MRIRISLILYYYLSFLANLHYDGGVGHTICLYADAELVLGKSLSACLYVAHSVFLLSDNGLSAPCVQSHAFNKCISFVS